MDKNVEHPQNYYETMLDWLSSNKRQDNTYKGIYHAEKMNGLEPKNITKSDRLYKPVFAASTAVSPEAFVTVLENGRLYGDKDNFAIISPDNSLIWDVSRGYEKNAADHWLFKQEKLPDVESSDETIAIISTVPGWQNNYYHWMFEIISRFHLIKKSGIKVDKYIIPTCSISYQFESLAALDIPREKIIEIHQSFHIKPKNLVIPSMLFHGLVTTWACNFLREQFLTNEMASIHNTQKFERVYISREKADYRKVINEDHVMEILSQYGFIKVKLHDLSFSEKVNIFSSAKYIIAPHDAGLANLVFCNPGTKIIEIFNPRYINPIYCWISNRKSLDYHYMLGEGKRPSVNLFYNNEHYPYCGDDIFVDLNKLKKAL
ncbi:hypothetical protein JOC95_004105 [Bacillus tianshenii]|uniref:Glycosyltransferase 61 catalytic domain-containing protein n=1 Tax=Sutcliffiella tianshenii TaxID=1463404 RepID=A0ABS2P5Q1_9BACI|nr:hypothetical protein [Bacillus tianshenii]